LYTNLQEADELSSLFVNIQTSSSYCGEHFWHNYPIRKGKNRILCNLLAGPSKWQLLSNNCRITSYIYCASRNKKFLFVFLYFPFCGRCTQQVLKTLRVPPCNNTAFRLCMEECEYSPFLWTVPYVHCCHQTLDDLTSTAFAVCCVDLLKIVLAGAKCCHFLQCRPEDSTFEVSKTTALLLFSTV
jgi:hypothetical protein